DWEGASRLLDGARTSLPFAELAELQQQLDAGRNRAGLDALVAEVQDKMGSGDLARAKELLDTGLGQYGRQERLLRLQQFWQRETAYRESMAAARKALAERRFDAASDGVQKALQAKPSDTEALALANRVAAERESARAEQAINIQEQLARAGNLEAAGRW